MKGLTQYIKECLDVENFSYKFDVWFKKEKTGYKPLLQLIQDCSAKKIVTSEDIDKFIENNPKFKLKEFIDFMDEDVKRDEAVTVDYSYLLLKLVETFIRNNTLFSKADYLFKTEEK